jgi:AraC-like DNA-binding protein
MTPHRCSRNAAGSGKSPAPSAIGLLVSCEIDTFMANGCGVPTIALVAERLSMHVRTLQRRLAEEQLAFRDVLGECRRRQAVAALSAGHLPIAEIAAQLGYSDPAHFARAFRAWTGRTPSSYRKMRRHASERGR